MSELEKIQSLKPESDQHVEPSKDSSDHSEIDDEIINLQQTKHQQITAITSQLQDIDPQVMELVQQGLMHITSGEISRIDTLTSEDLPEFAEEKQNEPVKTIGPWAKSKPSEGEETQIDKNSEVQVPKSAEHLQK